MDADPLGLKESRRDFLFPAAGMDEEEGKKFLFFILFSFSGFDDGEIVIWTPLAKEKTRFLRQHSRYISYVKSLSFSPDGRFLASAGHEELIIWSTEVKQENGTD